MKRLRIHSIVSGIACFVGLTTCIVACGGETGGNGHGGSLNVNYKFNVGNVNCHNSFVITKNSGTFPSSESVTLQDPSGTETGTVSLSTDMTQLTCTFPDTAPSGLYNVTLSDDGRIGTMAYTGCTN